MSSASNQVKIVGLLDWQHTSILPPFLFAGIPGRLWNYDDLAGSHPTLTVCMNSTLLVYFFM